MTTSPAPYASCLYGRLVDLRQAVTDSWRGTGTGATLAQMAVLEARIAELELNGPGSAWTALDEMWWRAAQRDEAAARLDAAHYTWLDTALDMAGIAMPAAFEETDR